MAIQHAEIEFNKFKIASIDTRSHIENHFEQSIRQLEKIANSATETKKNGGK